MMKLTCDLFENVDTELAKKICNEANNYTSKVTLIVNNNSVDAKKLNQVLELGQNWGNIVELRADGVDEKLACECLKRLFRQQVRV